ncbi:MAG: cell division protein ZipA [Xanthomonadales bacterium]|nr:cell division protein ZipA [Xanthomonadales bacterium]MDH3941690.1 cell division protein ZipA [Xanthomonadales bacterium]MDH4002898.1 cell division protein ZipA [Xanthomonadales bacterium]
METSTLRWILIVVGILIVASIFLFGNPNKKRKPKASRKPRVENAERREPTLDSNAVEDAARKLELEGEAGDPDLLGQGELDIGDEPVREAAAPKPRKPAGPAPDKIITLFLLAADNHVITGAELLQATVQTGMEYGDMKIFHRIPEGSEKPVFSMANAAKPGYFERDEWNTFETNGVVLFLTLPAPLNALDAWDAMLATGRRMAEVLHADLLDEERKPFTRQREAQLREEMRIYERQKS